MALVNNKAANRDFQVEFQTKLLRYGKWRYK